MKTYQILINALEWDFSDFPKYSNKKEAIRRASDIRHYGTLYLCQNKSNYQGAIICVHDGNSVIWQQNFTKKFMKSLK